MRLLIVALVCILAATAFAGKLQTYGDVSVDFTGLSGQFKIFRGDTSNPHEFIALSLDKLVEVGTGGKTAKINLASTNGEWADLTPLPENNGCQTTYTADLKNGATFVCVVTFFNNSQEIDGEVYTANFIKFSINVTDFPFLDPSNTLEWSVQLKNHGGARGDTATQQPGGAGKPQKVFVGPGVMVNPTVALVDGVSTDIGLNMSAANKAAVITWTFPNFKSVLDYDPMIYLDSASNSSSTSDKTKLQTYGDVSVDFTGLSGQFKIYRGDTASPTEFIALSLDKLVEVGTGKTASINLASTNGEWADLTALPENNGCQTTYTADLKNGATFVCVVTFFNNSQEIDGEVYTADFIKFSIMVTDFPFLGPSNTLEWSVQLKNHGGARGDTATQQPGGAGKPQKIFVGPGVMVNPTVALVDGVSTDIGLNMSAANKAAVITWTFPNFNRTLDYDPMLYLDPPASSSAVLDAIPLSVLAAAAALVAWVAM